MMLAFLEFFLFTVLGFTFIAQQPLSLGFFLILYCFFSSVLVFFFFSSWFSFSLFLIYIGGMLVLFGYVLVLTPNFVFSFKVYPFFFFFFFFYFYFPFGEFFCSVYSFSFSLFSFSNFLVYLFLAVILFVGLVSVVKICFFQVGALRPFFIFYV
uniref:NADH dehydrogenase subunit 6 n=1 Tax=Tetrastemma olgarum TaxID=1526548 RepID=A0A0U1WPR4_9BILA|nr:NADH dehydrogenase subunit 6 [Tetrastemma olgarum]AIH00388.1 NADH dehydrogenase subunit 6 [Tetrastemma olgarum]